MGQVLHGSARTTEAVHRAIQRSEESVRALARRHRISPTTAQKWRKRASVSDAPMGGDCTKVHSAYGRSEGAVNGGVQSPAVLS